MSEELQVVWLADLEAAAAGGDTDSFAVCQNPGGCSSGQPLVRMSLAQLKDYVGGGSAPPAPGVTDAVSVIGSLKGINLSGSVGDTFQFPIKFPFGQLYVVTDVIWANPSQPISGVQYDLKSTVGTFMTNGTIELPLVPDGSTTGGSIMRISTGPMQTSAYFTDQGQLVITGAFAPGTCDLYLLGFSL